LDQTLRIPAVFDAEDLEFDAGRPGVDDKDRVHRNQPDMAAARRRASAYSTATAHDAIRLRTESAREVRMMGTRAPSTRPAASALERKTRFFASMFPASRSGTTRICALPATGDWMPLIRAASGSMALSNANGPSTIPPVI